MRIVFAIEIFFPWQRGGAEVSTLELAGGLAQQGAEVSIVTPRLGEDATPLDLPGGVDLVRFDLPIFKPRGADTPFYVFNHPSFFARFARAIREQALSVRAQIVHAQNYYSYIPALRAARSVGVKAVATVRDYRLICPVAWCLTKDEAPVRCGMLKLHGCLREFWDQHERGALEPWPRFFVRHLYERFMLPFHRRAYMGMDAVHCVSSGLEEIYGRFGLAHPQGFVQHNPFEFTQAGAVANDVDGFKGRHGLSGKRILLFVGRFSIGKGARVLLGAYDKLRATRSDIALVVLGSNGLGSEVERFRGRDLLMAGVVARDELMRWYAASDVVVAPSLWPDPLPRVVAEAQAEGKPVVASRVGGIAEQVADGVSGLLVPVGDSDALASAILEVLDNPELAESLGRGAKGVAESRRPRMVAGRFLDWYRRVSGAG